MGMDDFDLKTGKERRWWAVALAAISIADAILVHTLSSRLNMCACLLAAWNLAFIPSPSLRTPLREIYERARRGWRSPWQSKIVMLASMSLFIAGEYYALHGR
jgi:hypothetical protein